MVRETKELKDHTLGSIENPRGDPVEQQSIPAPNWPMQTLTKKKLGLKLPTTGLSKTKAKILGLVLMAGIAAILTAVGMSIAFPPIVQNTPSANSKQIEQVKTMPTPTKQITKVIVTKKPIVFSTEKAPVVEKLKALDIIDTPWLTKFHQMFLVVLGLAILAFLGDSILGGKREIIIFSITMGSVLLMLYGYSWPISRQILISISGSTKGTWLVPSTLSVVVVCSIFGGLTPIASYFTLIGIFGALTGSIGEIGSAFGISDKAIVVPFNQAYDLWVLKQWNQAGLTIVCLVFLIIGFILHSRECGSRGFLIAILGGIVYVCFWVFTRSVPPIVVLFGIVLVCLSIGIALEAGKTRKVLVNLPWIGSKRTPFDIVGLLLTFLSIAYIFIGK